MIVAPPTHSPRSTALWLLIGMWASTTLFYTAPLEAHNGYGPRMGKPPKERRDKPTKAEPVDPKEAREHTASQVQDLLEQARTTPDPEQRVGLKMRAIQTLVKNKLFDQAKLVFGEIDAATLPPPLRIPYLLIKAELELNDHKAEQALKSIPPMDGSPEEYRVQAHRIRAEAYQQTGNRLQAIQELIAIEPLTQDPEMTQSVYTGVWQMLQQFSLNALKQWVAQSPPERLRGWIELAIVHKESLIAIATFDRRLQEWRSRYPQHPAHAKILGLITTEMQQLQQRPERYALLLPLTGQFARLGQSVKDGFVAAHFSSGDDRKKISMTLYDTHGHERDILPLYQRAIEDGAQIVVGPLRQELVAQLAKSSNLKVPVLALNALDLKAPDRLYYFSLSPEDEAWQVAERAIFENKFRTVVLTPDNAWGAKVARAFRERYTALGGTVVEARAFNPSQSDYSVPMRKLFNMDESRFRFNGIKTMLGTKIQFEPRRRQDLDFVFVAAFPPQARLIAPQLRFHQLGDLPVYATSHIYTGIEDVTRDADMNGITFCDMPWNLLLDKNPSPVTTAIKAEWPERMGGFARFYALGVDAYNIIPYLNWLKSQPAERLSGQTGSLSVDAAQRVRRNLHWARFVNGKIVIQQEQIVPTKQTQSTTAVFPAHPPATTNSTQP